MNIYTALLRPDAEPVLVREGFTWGGLILGPIWLAAHRAWIPAALNLAVLVLIIVLCPQPARAILLLALALTIGLTGNDLRRWALVRRGFLLQHVLAAPSLDGALVRLLAARPELIAGFRRGAA